MINHIVLFSVKHETMISDVVENLTRLSEIPGCKNFQINRNKYLDQFSQEIDIILTCQFDDHRALASYKSHPTYRYVTEVVKKLRDQRFVIDF